MTVAPAHDPCEGVPSALSPLALPPGLARELPFPHRLPSPPTRQGAWTRAILGACAIGLLLAWGIHRASPSLGSPPLGILCAGAVVVASALGAVHAVTWHRRQVRLADAWRVMATVRAPEAGGPTWADVCRAALALTREGRTPGLPVRARDVAYEVAEAQLAASVLDTTSPPSRVRAHFQAIQGDLVRVADAAVAAEQGGEARRFSSWLRARALPAGFVRRMATQPDFAAAWREFAERVGPCTACHGEQVEAARKKMTEPLMQPLMMAVAFAMPGAPRTDPALSRAASSLGDASLEGLRVADRMFAVRLGCSACDACLCRVCAGLEKDDQQILCPTCQAPLQRLWPEPESPGGRA